MAIQLHCDVCRAFIQNIDIARAKRMGDSGDRTICTTCEKAKQAYVSKCEKVLLVFQKEAQRMRSEVEKQFLEILKTTMEENSNAKDADA